MTAPQPTNQPSANHNSQTPEQKGGGLQKGWLVTLGLLGSFGFVTSQVDLAIAETNLLIGDYTPSAEADPATAYSASAVNNQAPYAQASPSQTSEPPIFEAVLVAAQPQPEAFIDASANLSETIESFAVAPPPQAQLIAPSAVTAVAPPTFTASRVQQPVPGKLVKPQRISPLAGLLGASAMAAPLSDYARGPVAMAPANASSADLAPGLALESPDSGAVEDAPAAPAAPIVEIAPPAPASTAPVKPTELVPAMPSAANLPDEYNSVFVDPTDYSVGATAAPNTAAPNVVVSEQSTGCGFTVRAGQGVPNGACGAGQASGSAVGNAPAPAYTNNQQTAQASGRGSAGGGSAVNVGPVSFSANGIRFSGATTAAGRDYLNRSVRPIVNLQLAQRFIFPLSIPSPITSLFGFRIHPISGDQRFHSGTDIGAAQGTPVLAAQDGVVASADYAGGYGLMIVLEHDKESPELQSRYAHLSEILVEPGSRVNRGDVIGLVGSTGNSTGPHLHFEMLQATASGWIMVNPDGLVQASLANLVKALNDPMSVASFNLADLGLNLNRGNAAPARTPASVSLPVLPGQNGVPFRPAQPNAS